MEISKDYSPKATTERKKLSQIAGAAIFGSTDSFETFVIKWIRTKIRNVFEQKYTVDLNKNTQMIRTKIHSGFEQKYAIHSNKNTRRIRTKVATP
jgi:hypothetical protein